MLGWNRIVSKKLNTVLFILQSHRLTTAFVAVMAWCLFKMFWFEMTLNYINCSLRNECTLFQDFCLFTARAAGLWFHHVFKENVNTCGIDLKSWCCVCMMTVCYMFKAVFPRVRTENVQTLPSSTWLNLHYIHPKSEKVTSVQWSSYCCHKDGVNSEDEI